MIQLSYKESGINNSFEISCDLHSSNELNFIPEANNQFKRSCEDIWRQLINRHNVGLKDTGVFKTRFRWSSDIIIQNDQLNVTHDFFSLTRDNLEETQWKAGLGYHNRAAPKSPWTDH